MPYSDNPSTTYSDNPSNSRGYRDRPDPPAPNDYQTQDGTPYEDEDDIPISSIPPSSLFPFVGGINNSIINRGVSPTKSLYSDEEESVGDFVRSLNLDTDDNDNTANNSNNKGGLTNGAPASSNEFIWHLTPGSAGKEVDSIFVNGYDKSLSNQQHATPVRKVMKLAILGFFMGIIVMLVLLLVGTSNVDDGSSSRLGAPSGSTTALLDGFDQSIDTTTTALNLDEDGTPEIIVEEGEKDSAIKKNRRKMIHLLKFQRRIAVRN